jgi:hypothetical protein
MHSHVFLVGLCGIFLLCNTDAFLPQTAPSWVSFSQTRLYAAEGDALKIIIAGAPASGKGTQCEIIKEKYGVVHLSTGDMLRAAVADQTEVGKAAKEYMDSGKLVPDDVIIGVVSIFLSRIGVFFATPRPEHCIPTRYFLFPAVEKYRLKTVLRVQTVRTKVGSWMDFLAQKHRLLLLQMPESLRTVLFSSMYRMKSWWNALLAEEQIL